MELRPWRDRLESELARRGVPAGYRARLLAELGDHIHDLTEEGEAMSEEALEATVGRPADVAAAAAEEYRKASWVRRHPVLVFGLLPLPVTLLVVIGLQLLVDLIFVGVTEAAGEAVPRPVFVGIVTTTSYAFRFVPFVLTAAWFARLAVRRHVQLGWLVASVGQVAAFGGAFVSRVIVSDVPGQSMWVLGFSLPAPDALRASEFGSFFLAPHWSQLVQLAAPVAVGGLFVRLARRRGGALAAA